MKTIVHAEPEHIEYIADHARREDVDEIFAVTGLGIKDAFKGVVETSDQAYTYIVDGVPACVFGVSIHSFISGKWNPWMIATEEIEHDRHFLKNCRQAFKELSRGYVHLENYVDSRNKKAISWLRWLGFTIHDSEPYGVSGLPFHRFEMKRS